MSVEGHHATAMVNRYMVSISRLLIPDKQNLAILDRTHFVFREQFGMDVINADLLGDAPHCQRQ